MFREKVPEVGLVLAFFEAGLASDRAWFCLWSKLAGLGWPWMANSDRDLVNLLWLSPYPNLAGLAGPRSGLPGLAPASGLAQPGAVGPALAEPWHWPGLTALLYLDPSWANRTRALAIISRPWLTNWPWVIQTRPAIVTSLLSCLVPTWPRVARSWFLPSRSLTRLDLTGSTGSWPWLDWLWLIPEPGWLCPGWHVHCPDQARSSGHTWPCLEMVCP